MKITIAQLNPVIGDIEGNLEKAGNALSRCAGDASDLIVFSELFLAGYPPRDLLERSRFVERVKEAVDRIVAMSSAYPQTGILMGAPTLSEEKLGRGFYNSALLIFKGAVAATQHKSLLPNYD
ncbi:MAG: nitrilase-related carbon-nitrogen hydrolase, partial [Pseudomonadota bacterium]